jgi:tetratricopeptide (TPR) repeat protein
LVGIQRYISNLKINKNFAILIYLSVSYFNLGDDNKALEYYKKSLEMLERLYPGAHQDIALSLNNLGASYSRLGDVNKSLEYYKKSFEMLERLYTGDHPDIALS